MQDKRETKVAIVTGATRGIGRSTAVQLAEKGYFLTLVGRIQQELHNLGEEIRSTFGVQVIICTGDLADERFWNEIVATSLRTWNRIDLLVNNAAWRSIEPMSAIDLDIWDKTIRICLSAPAFLSKQVAAHMIESQRGGVIINVSSVMSQRTGGYSPAYAACKGGIESLTYELATLYGPAGIRVVCVNPGNIETDMSSDYHDSQGNNVSKDIGANMIDHTPLKRAARPDEIAQIIVWLSSGQASYITGTTVLADGGFTHNFNSYSMKHLQFPSLF